MGEDTEERLERGIELWPACGTVFELREPVFPFPENPFPRPLPNEHMMGKNYVPEEVDSLTEFSDRNLLRMEFQTECFTEEYFDLRECCAEKLGIFGNDHEIVGIADVVVSFQDMFRKLVELVHIHVRKELGSKVSDGYTLLEEIILGPGRDETLHNIPEEFRHAVVLYSFPKSVQEDVMVDGIEELRDVAFECVTRPRTVPARFHEHRSEFIDPGVNSFPLSAWKRIVDERRIEYRFERSDYGVVKNSVGDGSLVDVATLRIEDVKIRISGMPVLARPQFPGKPKDVRFEVRLEFKHIRFITLPLAEFIPCPKEGFRIGNQLERIYFFTFTHMEHLEIPIIKKSYELYKQFHEYRRVVPKADRYTVYERSEGAMLDMIELLLEAGYGEKSWKSAVLWKVSVKLNVVRLFIRLMKETKTFDTKKYVVLQESIDEIGRMLGGWMRSVER